ncbi:hypothetical protein HYH02_003602 [Chlamydomonas schloesseri]|uniref:Uncharacterized protein n=1 Tax=Chlamydomonas schloesseri TaxID=2026947 RepID=A0A835WQL7_9CHLO|nr:hypothetical protein HYH02_003602 [Chlamydomonas schloesseri]|eukprot:KAG2451826.1 hypothetical protein HYH02_003602 [Chlamydomonas schloesseri]
MKGVTCELLTTPPGFDKRPLTKGEAVPPWSEAAGAAADTPSSRRIGALVQPPPPAAPPAPATKLRGGSGGAAASWLEVGREVSAGPAVKGKTSSITSA